MPLPPWEIAIEVHGHVSTAAKKGKLAGAKPAHSHSYPSLLITQSGKGACELNGIEHSLGPDTAILVPPGAQHATYDVPGSPMNIFAIGFDTKTSLLSAAAMNTLFSQNASLSLQPFEAKQIYQLLRVLLHEQQNKAIGYEISMQTALNNILTIILRNIDRETVLGHSTYDSLAKVREVLSFIESHSYEHHTLAEAAQMAHLSQRQFSNLCNQIKGMSYVALVNKARCEKAMELITATKRPISSIGFEVGFEEASTFYRAFRKHFSKAPSAFRN